VGYSDLSTFRRLFRRETGLSPREYQRRFSRRPRQKEGNATQVARQRMSDLPR
jgi:AraC-like DNA-binding protein